MTRPPHQRKNIKEMSDMRTSGILFPISSLPSRFGIGSFSAEALEFIDFLEAAGQTYWQVLPFGPTGYGDSPYQSLSTFAGNPYFISPDELIKDGLVTEEDCAELFFGSDPGKVDYGALYNDRQKLLKKAYVSFKAAGPDPEFSEFVKNESYWLEDYCLFMALKKKNEQRPWNEWDTEYRGRDAIAIAAAREVLEESVDFYRFQQYMFMKQWKKVRAYAASKGIKIIGDIPIYVAMDSSDAWAYPSQFEFDDEDMPVRVAGCPPDAFSATGQLWGNPLYDWKAARRDGYDWWIRRIKRSLDFYDVIRIDHFRGFDEYYAVPYGDKTAENGTWEKGPGRKLFDAIRKALGDVPIIAEDLGYITPSVREMLDDLGFPGMKVLQFAFDGSEASAYLTYKHERNSVVYTGTHDNMTTRGWIESINDHDRDFARRFINSVYTDYGQFTWDFIREAMRSASDLCIIPMQDYLVLGNEARMNEPSSAMGNWTWRAAKGDMSPDLARAIFEMTKLYGRLAAKPEIPEKSEEAEEPEKAAEPEKAE